MNKATRVLAAVVGLILPWQTRWIFSQPLVGGVVWDFGIIACYVGQVVLLAWLLQELWWRRQEINWSGRWRGSVALLLLAAGINIFFSAARSLSVAGWLSIFLLGGLFLLVRQQRELIRPLLGGFLISVLLQVLLGLAQVFFGGSFASTLLGIAAHSAPDSGAAVVTWGEHRYLRAYGGQPHPNIFGGLVLVSLLWYAELTTATTSLITDRKNIIKFTALLTAALFFSFSRAAWIGLLLAGGLFWWRRRTTSDKIKLFWKTAAITAAVLLVVFAPLVWSRVGGGGAVEERAVQERVSLLSTGWRVGQTTPFFGTGLWAFTAAAGGTSGDARQPIHLVPLLALVELGLVSGALVLGALLRLCPRKKTFWLALVPLAPLLLFDHYLWSLWPGLVILFFGLILANEQSLDKRI